MNKIYKVIWSKVKNCYVVASELAKSRTKAPNSGVVGTLSLEKKIFLAFCSCNYGESVSLLNTGFVADTIINPNTFVFQKEVKPFTITVAAIVKNEAENVPVWVQSARSCADEIVVVDTGSTDGTVERFADYGIKCFHYDWNDDFASAKNYMISLCHSDWIVLLDGDEWFREGCDVRKAIAKHHNNPVTKAIIADWICLDKDRNNAVMFSGGAVRAFRNQLDVRYFRKVHENLTINYENFVFEPEFKMYHTGYSGSVNRSKHERNLRIMRTMFDFDNGKVEYPTDWRYIEDTYAGLGQFDKALWAADKMISYGVQEYSAAAWITKFNVLFAMKTPLAEMKKQFEYCFQTVPSVSGFRFLASIYYFRNGYIEAGLDNYIEGLCLLMGPQDKVAMEHTYWRMYLPEASALASAVYLQNKQVEAALYACKVSEQYCGKSLWTNNALRNVRCVLAKDFSFNSVDFPNNFLSILSFAKKAVLTTVLASSITVGIFPVSVFAGCIIGGTNHYEAEGNSVLVGGSNNTSLCSYGTIIGGHNHRVNGSYGSIVGGACNQVFDSDGSVFGGCNNHAGLGYWYTVDGTTPIYVRSDNVDIQGDKINHDGTYYQLHSIDGDYATVVGGTYNLATACNSFVGGGHTNFAVACYASVVGGEDNIASGIDSSVFGGECNLAQGSSSTVVGGYCNVSSSCYSIVIGGKSGTSSACYSAVFGGGFNIASCQGAVTVGGSCNTSNSSHSLVAGGKCNISNGYYSVVIGGSCNSANSGCSIVVGGHCGRTYAGHSISIGGGITGISTCSTTAQYSVAIGQNAMTTKNYEVTIGSSCAPVTIGGNLTVDGAKTVTDGTITKTWSDLLNASGGGSSIPFVGIMGGLSTDGNYSGDGATGTYAIAIGRIASASSGHTIAIGPESTATNFGSISLGAESTSSHNYAIAIGEGAYAKYADSIAIGRDAVTDADNTVSFGHKSIDIASNGNAYGTNVYRRLINISNGVDANDAATYGQVSGTIKGLSVSGKTITYTKVDGTTGTITTQDTDTHYTTHLYAGSGTAANATTTNGNTKIALADNSTVRNTLTIKGTGATTVTSDANGVITINSTDTNTTYSAFTGATASAAGTTGLVPAPAKGKQNAFLRGDGTWVVPTDTNTHYTTHLYAGSGTAANAATSNGSTKIALTDDSTVRNTLTIKGTGATTVTSDANGVITINSTDNNTTYSAMSADELNTGTATTGRTMTAKVLSDYVKGKTDDKITGLSVSGTTITYTKGDGTTGTITTQDNNTTYSAGNADLISAGTNTGNRVWSSKVLADYVKGKTDDKITGLSVSGQTITYTKGDGTTGTITTQDNNTTYSAATSSALGLVKVGSNITNSSGTISLTKANVTSALGYTPPTTDTDTHYTSHLYVGSGTASNAATTNGNTKIALYDDSTAREAITIKGGGKTTVTSDANGVITISSTDANTTYSAGNGVSLSGTIFSAKPYNGITVDSNGIGVKAGTNVTVNSNGVSVTGSGSVASGNTGLISGGTLFTESRITADGTFAKKANTTATNITALDTAAKNAIKDLSVSGKVITYTKGDGTTGTITTQDTNTTYSAFTGATSSAAGTAGLVKAPAAGDQNKFLRGDGTWAVDNNTTYTNMSASELNTGTATTARSISAKVIADYVTDKVSAETTARNTAISSEATARADADTALDARVDESIKGLSVSGKTITYTKGDGTTGTITTQDTNTTYSAGNGIALSGTTFSAKAGTNVSVDSNGINVVGNGSVASGNTGLVSGGTLFTENRITADGTFAKKANTTAANITALDTATKNAIKGLSVSGKTITYTKGDGTTGTITTQDTNTTYDNMSATELSTGTATTARTISAKTIADYVTGKVSAETTARTTAINSEATTRANADTALGARIDNVITAYESADTDLSSRIGSVASDGTFIKKSATNDVAANLTALDTAAKNAIKGLSVSGRTITYTKGDGTTGTITTQDNNTTYSAFTGATSSAAGTAGLVKAPAAGDQNKFLRGDGTWAVDNDTKYTAMTASEATTGTGTTARSITAKVLADYVGGKVTDAKNGTITDLSISGRTITYTKGDGTTGTITTQDNNTIYSAGNGLSLSGTTFSAKPYNGITVDSNGIGVKAGTNITVDSNGVNVAGNGTVVSGDTGLISGGTAYTELRPADGNYVKLAKTTAENLTALDTQIKSTDNTAIKGLSVSGKTITYTKGDGTTGTITTQDTTYGNMSASELSTGTATTARSISAKVISDYVKGKTDDKLTGLSVSGKTITYTKGDGTTGTITTQDTTYGTGTVANLTTGTDTTAKVWTSKVLADYVKGEVSTETTARTSADTNLSNRIGTVSANGNYIKASTSKNIAENLGLLDTQLKTTTTAVSTEATTRANADTALGTRIDGTITGLSVSGKVITYTKGDGTTGTIKTQDTTYGTGTAANLTTGTDTTAKVWTSKVLADYVKGEVSTETTARTTADTNLSNRIGTVSADGNYIKKSATKNVSENLSLLDTQLKTTTTAVSTEATTRANADTALSNRIGELSVNGSYIRTTNNVYENLVALDSATASKANIDASNIGRNASGENTASLWGTALGTDELQSGSNVLFTSGGAYSELHLNDNGNYMDSTKTTAQNLALLDAQLKTTYDLVTNLDGIVVQYDDNTKGKVTLQGGSDGTVIDKVKAGTLSATSMEAVNGNQLYTTNQKLATEISERQTAVTAEETARTTADTVLGNRIGTVSANGNFIKKSTTKNIAENLVLLDTALKTTNNTVSANKTAIETSLAGEVSARESADSGLSDRIGVVSADKSYIKASSSKNVSENLELLDDALTATDTNLAQEIADREAGDTALSNKIGSIATNGNYIQKDATVFSNLFALDSQLKSTIENLGTVSGNAVSYDNADKKLVTFAGQGGTVLDNVKAGQLSVSSLQAVNGAQLYATNQNIAGFAADINRNKANIASLNTSVTAALGSVSSTSTLVSTLDSLKADASLNNLTVAGRNVIAVAAANAVQEYMAAQQSTNIESPVAPMAYNPNSLTVTNAGNGSLYVGEGSNVNGSQSIAIGVGNQVNANNSGAFGDPSIINADESYVLGNDDTINTGATGSFVVGNDSVSSAKGGLTFGSNNNLEETAENSVALGNNVSISGRNSVALGSDSTATEDNVISVGNDTLKRKITNVANGNIAEDSTDAVTGSQLFAMNKRVKANEDAVATKANLDASNIDVDSWTTKLGTGAVESGNTGLVNGGTVFTAIQKIQDNQLIQQDGDTLHIGSTVGGNTISVANSAGEGRVITGVATDPANPYSATNVGYVQSVSENIINAVNNSISKVDSKVNKVGANAAALASLTPASFEGDEKWSLAASFGHYEGQTAGAVGAFYKPAENVMLNLRGSFASGENMFGGGVAVSLSKGDVPGVTKRQMAVTINKQASAINELQQNQQVILQEREQDKQLISNILQAREQDQKRIAELEAMVQKMAKQMNAGK